MSETRVTISRKNQYGEYVVRLWQEGKLVADYFTDDKQDAIDTAAAMLAARLSDSE